MKNIVLKSIAKILVFTLLLSVTSCEKSSSEEIGKNNTEVKTAPNPAPTPYPATYHSGYKKELPKGGIYKDKKIFYTAPAPIYIEHLAYKFIEYTNYYTVTDFVKGIANKNKLTSHYLAKGQKIEIDKVREFAPNPKTVKKDKTFEARGVYITNVVAGSGAIFDIVAKMKKLNMNTVIIDAKDMSGVLSYKTNVPLAKQIKADNSAYIRDLKKLIEKLHSYNIHVAMRQVLFFDQILSNGKTEYAIKSKSTGKPWKEVNTLTWVDPSKKAVQDYNLAISKELAEFGVDEIQYDYVRFPAWGNTKDAKYSFDEKKIQKHEIITGYLKRAREELKPYNVIISVDVYGIIAWDRTADLLITGQKLDDMAKYVDVISPMLYPSHFFAGFGGMSSPGSQPYKLVNEGINKLRKKVDGTGVVIRPWLQSFNLKSPNYSPNYILEQIKASNDAYCGGWLLWNAGNYYVTAFQGIEKIKNKYPTQAELDKKYALKVKTEQIKAEKDKAKKLAELAKKKEIKKVDSKVNNTKKVIKK